MTLSRLAALEVYWDSFPPVHCMIASYFGIKPKEAPNKQEDIGQLLAMFPLKT
jgi:hypothetical protein